MNIKIKHFQKKTPYSSSGKNKLLATLGLVASLGIAGCETTSVTSGVVAVPESSSSAEAPEGGVLVMPESSSSEEPPLAGEIQMPESSSSAEIILQPTEIPLSGDVLYTGESSSSIELIKLDPIDTDPPMSGIIAVPIETFSSMSSSSSEEPPLSGGVQVIDSSSSTDSPKAGIVEIPESSSSTNASLDDESLIL